MFNKKLLVGLAAILAAVVMMPNCATAAPSEPYSPTNTWGTRVEVMQEANRQVVWNRNARNALTKFASIDTGNEEVMAYSHVAGASGRLNGWSSPVTIGYINKVYSLEKTTGGWGLSYSYDAFSDGSINPVSTVYAVTLAGHVGSILLEGYNAGVVPASKIQWIVDKLVSMPRVPVSVGKCVAYSDQIADGKTGLCVHNVNAGVGAFLAQASMSGFTASGMSELISGINTQESTTYSATSKFWAYYNGKPTTLQDPDHNSYSAESMYLLNRSISKDSAAHMMKTFWPSDTLSPIVHMRLTSLPDGSQRVAGDKYFTEVANFIAKPPALAGNRLAQAAYYSSRNIRGK